MTLKFAAVAAGLVEVKVPRVKICELPSTPRPDAAVGVTVSVAGATKTRLEPVPDAGSVSLTVTVRAKTPEAV